MQDIKSNNLLITIMSLNNTRTIQFDKKHEFVHKQIRI